MNKGGIPHEDTKFLLVIQNQRRINGFEQSWPHFKVPPGCTVHDNPGPVFFVFSCLSVLV